MLTVYQAGSDCIEIGQRMVDLGQRVGRDDNMSELDVELADRGALRVAIATGTTAILESRYAVAGARCVIAENVAPSSSSLPAGREPLFAELVRHYLG